MSLRANVANSLSCGALRGSEGFGEKLCSLDRMHSEAPMFVWNTPVCVCVRACYKRALYETLGAITIPAVSASFIVAAPNL